MNLKRLMIDALAEATEVDAAMVIGSSSSAGDDDPLSDLDLYLFVDVAPPSRQQVRCWLERVSGLTVGMHYWNGIEKHHLVVGDSKLDLTIKHVRDIDAVRHWPGLFFALADIVIDRHGRLAAAYAANRVSPTTSTANDRDSLVFHTLSVAAQLARGEVLNARSRATGIIEGELRIMLREDLGSSRWREPSRYAERDLGAGSLGEVYALCEASNEDFVSMIVQRLTLLLRDPQMSCGMRAVVERHRSALIRRQGARRTLGPSEAAQGDAGPR